MTWRRTVLAAVSLSSALILAAGCTGGSEGYAQLDAAWSALPPGEQRQICRQIAALGADGASESLRRIAPQASVADRRRFAEALACHIELAIESG